MRIILYICLIVSFVVSSCQNAYDSSKVVNEHIVSVVQSLLENGEECLNKYDYMEGANMFADAYNLSKHTNDSALVQYCANKYIWSCYRSGNLEQAENLIRVHKATDHASKAVEIYMAAKNNQCLDSDNPFKDAWALTDCLKDTIDVLFIEAQAYSISNNFRKASESYREYANRFAKQSSYELVFQTNKATQRYKYITISFFLIAIPIVLILFYRQKKTRKKLELMLDMAKELRCSNQERDSIIEEKQKLIAELFKNQFRYINDLANNYYSYNSSPSASSIMYNYVTKTLDKIAKENTSSIHLENIINNYHNGVIERIREQIPSLSEEYIRLYCYYCAGFSPQMISLLTNDGIDNVYKKKSRLKNKLCNSNAADKDFFIGLIF